MHGSGVEWIVFDPFIAETLGPLFERDDIAVTVVHVKP